MLERSNGNAIIIHGGGLVDPSKFVLLELAHQLSRKKVYSQIYLGRYSFEALYTPEFWMKYGRDLELEVHDKRGTWFGTCRGIDLTDPILFSKAIKCMKERNVTTLIVAGGDGSARQCAETQAMFEKNGINVIFPIPLTVDGINGGSFIGLDQAVREIIRQTENIVSTSLQTRDNGKFSVVAVETQGRNRDDIMANVLKEIHEKQKVADINIHDLLLIAVPANMKTDINVLEEKVNNSKQRTLILISEGADIKISDITKRINRKVRSLVVGHQVQSNNTLNEFDKALYSCWLNIITNVIKVKPKKSYSLVYTDSQNVRIEKLSYYAELNPREGQIAKLPGHLEELIKEYMA